VKKLNNLFVIYLFKMRTTILLLLFLGIASQGFAQTNAADPRYQLLSGGNFVQSKNYYLLTLLNEIPAVKKLLQNDQQLMKLTADHRSQVQAAIKGCGKDLPCYINAVSFSTATIDQVGSRLGQLYQPGNALGLMVKQHLLPSGCYNLYEGTGDKQILINAWKQDAKAVNHTISVYAKGSKANSPQIDSIAFDVSKPGYIELIALNAGLALAEAPDGSLFYQVPLLFALHSLEINERNQAGDYEPMEQTVNKAALQYAAKLNWAKYKYTLILVPGEGPEEKDVALSAGGMLRCRLAAIQYQKGLAPFIMVSGGCVHPYKTKFNEALEMKKFLMANLHIPESAIVMEPHARHTTTNMRNCARLIFRYGFPMDKPCLVSTVKSQSFYITNMLQSRCTADFGYVPYKTGNRLSDTEAEFYPLSSALQLDFDEPMDP
jgi:hypothetical protein